MKNKNKFTQILFPVLGMALAVMNIPMLTKAAAPSDEILLFRSTAELTVYIDGELSGTLTQTCEVGDIVTLEAPKNEKTFSYWAVSLGTDKTSEPEKAEKASTLEKYTLAVNADVTLYAVYSDTTVTAEPVAAFTAAVQHQDLKTGNDAIRLTTTFSIPQNQTFTEAGIIYTDNKLLTGADSNTDFISNPIDGLDIPAMLKGTKNRGRVRKVTAPSGAKDWTLTLKSSNKDTPVYAVAYLTIGSQIYYSNVLTVTYNTRTKGISAVYDMPSVVNADADKNEITISNKLDDAVKKALEH